jgi:hypothetical protein
MNYAFNPNKFKYWYFGATVQIEERLIVNDVKMARITGDFPKGFYPNKSLAVMNALWRL